MKNLIEALQLIQSYLKEDIRSPTLCQDDCLYLHVGLEWSDLTAEHQARLEDLGFHWDDDVECIASYRFGSC